QQGAWYGRRISACLHVSIKWLAAAPRLEVGRHPPGFGSPVQSCKYTSVWYTSCPHPSWLVSRRNVSLWAKLSTVLWNKIQPFRETVLKVITFVRVTCLQFISHSGV